LTRPSAAEGREIARAVFEPRAGESIESAARRLLATGHADRPLGPRERAAAELLQKRALGENHRMIAAAELLIGNASA